ncbi:hypothetical protein SPFL3101_01402 [Sporomusaceae bacterium FL31]|nr:hypothetical protein SPFL3101_01402 [Sporomusaceae bacterium FL31]
MQLKQADDRIISVNIQPQDIATYDTPFESLDSLLDCAYMQKEQQNFTQALNTLRRALELYSDNDYAPFIIIEISNILKNKGAYDEAIRIYAHGHSLTVVQKDNQLRQEFVNTIAYFRILKNILLSHGIGLIPFEQIPLSIREEIDNEFLDWRLATK